MIGMCQALLLSGGGFGVLSGNVAIHVKGLGALEGST